MVSSISWKKIFMIVEEKEQLRKVCLMNISDSPKFKVHDLLS